MRMRTTTEPHPKRLLAANATGWLNAGTMVSLLWGAQTGTFGISKRFCGFSSYQLRNKSASTIETSALFSSSPATASLSRKLFPARHCVVNSTGYTSPFTSSSYMFDSMFSLSRFLLRDVLVFSLLDVVAFISQQLILSGDIETNPGPKLKGTYIYTRINYFQVKTLLYEKHVMHVILLEVS